MEKLTTIHISIDGLTPQAVNICKNYLSNIYKLKKLYTDDARTDNLTITLPNHVSMFTGRSSDKHKVYHNDDNNDNKTIHKKKYIKSIFSVLKDNNLKCSMYVGKTKFNFIDRSYSDIDDGIDEIDMFCCDITFKTQHNNNIVLYYDSEIKETDKNNVIPIVKYFMDNFNKNYDYTFIHFRGTDTIGHMYGWLTKEYFNSLKAIDNDIGEILKFLDKYSNNYIIILTSDHGGFKQDHNDNKIKENFTIPFYIYLKDYDKKIDLYSLCDNRYKPNKNINPSIKQIKQPIRNGDIANLVLQLQGIMKEIDGSNINTDKSIYKAIIRYINFK